MTHWLRLLAAAVILGAGVPASLSAADRRAELSDETQQEIAAFKEAHARFLALYDARRYAEAEGEVTKALAIARRLLGNDHLITATEISNLAALYTSMQRYAEAEPLFAEALAIRRKKLKPGDRLILATLRDLQTTQMVLGRAAAERSTLEAMLGFFDGEPPRDVDRFAFVLDRLGVLAIGEGDLASARRKLELALRTYRERHGEEDVRTALSLSNLAVVDVKEGKLEPALERFRRVLAVREKRLGETAPATLQTLGEIAGLEDQLQRRAAAVVTARLIVERRQKALGADHAELAGDHNRLSAYAYRAGDLDLSGRELARAIEIAEKNGGDDHASLPVYLRNLATLLEDMGAYDRAEPVYRRHLAVIEKRQGERTREVVDAVGALGRLNRQLARYDEAETLFFDALTREAQAQNGERQASPQRIANFHNHLAGLYRAQGRFEDAAGQYKTAETLFLADKTTPAADVAKLYDNIGVLNLELDRLDLAESYHKRALALFEQALGPDHADVALCLNNLGAVYDYRQRADLSLPLYQRALALYEKKARPSDPMIGVFNDNLAGAYRSTGRLAEAETHYRRAMEALVRAHGDEHPEIALAHSNLAALHAEQGDFAGADALYEKALGIAGKTLGAGHPQMAQYLRLRGTNAVDAGNLDAAGGYYRAALAIAEQTYGPDHEQTGRILGPLAVLELRRQDYATSLALYRRATRIEAGRQKHRAARAEAGETAGNTALFAGLAISLWFVAAASDNAEEKDALREEALLAVQQAQTSAAGAALAQMAARFAAGDGNLAAAVRERQDLTRQHTRLDRELISLIGAGDGPQVSRRRQQLADLSGRIDALDARLAQDFPAFASLAAPRPLGIEEIRAQLAADEALLLYQTSNEAVYAFAVTTEGADWQRVELRRDDLRQKVAKLRAALDPTAPGAAIRGLKAEGEPQPAAAQPAAAAAGGAAAEEPHEADTPLATDFDLAVAHELHAALLEPFAGLIGARRHLLLVAADALTGLPFHVLLTGPADSTAGDELAVYRGAPWLIRRHAVTTLPSVASLHALRRGERAKAAAKALIGFGDPVFSAAQEQAAPTRLAAAGGFSSFYRGGSVDLAAFSALAPLPETRDELVSVAKTLGVAEENIRLGRAASEKAVKELDKAGELARRRIVYFATHGLIAGDIKGLAEPALALSLPQAADATDDGLLTASEVAQLKLNADWVVLSACNTAAGTSPGAEALSGLARAFFYAGAKSLLVSHWPVYSDAAARLTTSAFSIIDRQKKAGSPIGRAEALRLAMLAVIDEPAGGFAAHPSYWAPFVVVGEGGARGPVRAGKAAAGGSAEPHGQLRKRDRKPAARPEPEPPAGPFDNPL